MDTQCLPQPLGELLLVRRVSSSFSQPSRALAAVAVQQVLQWARLVAVAALALAAAAAEKMR
jgi:hypothetical protein